MTSLPAPALVLLAALGATAPAAAQSRPPSTPRPPAAAAPSAAADQAAALRARADSARLPWTAADVRFMAGMIGHHGQAVTMSRLAPARGASPAVRTLAARIINAQLDEIAVMRQWLRDRGQPVPPAPDTAAVPAADAHAGHDMAGHGAAGHGGSGHAAGGHEGAGHAAMPGMLTAAQMAQLEAARGAEFDRLFLTFMIQHHRGATAMVTELFATPGAGQDDRVFKFASDVNVDQTTEIARMQRMLAAVLFGAQ
jgi:uncharacterized protein (DUF305 family)